MRGLYRSVAVVPGPAEDRGPNHRTGVVAPGRALRGLIAAGMMALAWMPKEAAALSCKRVNPVIAAADAAAVVEGAILEASPTVEGSVRQTFRLRVDAVYKGAPTVGESLDLTWFPWDRLVADPNQRSVWFLYDWGEGLSTDPCAPRYAAEEAGRAREAVRLSAQVTPARAPHVVDPTTPPFVLGGLALGWRLDALRVEREVAAAAGTPLPDGAALFRDLRAAIGVGYALPREPERRMPGLLADVSARVGRTSFATELLTLGASLHEDWSHRPRSPEAWERVTDLRIRAFRAAEASFAPVWGRPEHVEPLLRAACTALAEAPCGAVPLDSAGW